VKLHSKQILEKVNDNKNKRERKEIAKRVIDRERLIEIDV
jgi:hypothetical protein